jgi:hypothetical protein
MEPLADLPALRVVLDSLKSKGLVIALTSEGRGHVVTHALYKPREIETLKAKYAGGWAGSSDEEEAAAPLACVEPPVPRVSPPSYREGVDLGAIGRELSSLRQQVAQFRQELDEVRDAQSQTADELQSLKASLGG